MIGPQRLVILHDDATQDYEAVRGEMAGVNTRTVDRFAVPLSKQADY